MKYTLISLEVEFHLTYCGGQEVLLINKCTPEIISFPEIPLAVS